MAKYHKYVFDFEKREFVGDFEKMYCNEVKEGFEPWVQADCMELSRKIVLSVLEGYNFDRILDLGCGKGYFTQFFKKHNNFVRGVDVSATAVSRAKISFPKIDFMSGDVTNKEFFNEMSKEGKYDLVFSYGLLQYTQDYPVLLRNISKVTKYFLLYEPILDNPIGFVKSKSDLLDAVEGDYCIENNIFLDSIYEDVREHSIILMLKSKCVLAELKDV